MRAMTNACRGRVRKTVAGVLITLILITCGMFLFECSTQKVDDYVRVIGVPSGSAEIEPTRVDLYSVKYDNFLLGDRLLVDNASVPSSEDYTLITSAEFYAFSKNDGMYFEIVSSPVSGEGFLRVPSSFKDMVLPRIESCYLEFDDGQWRAKGVDCISAVTARDGSELYLTIDTTNRDNTDLSKEWLFDHVDGLENICETYINDFGKGEDRLEEYMKGKLEEKRWALGELNRLAAELEEVDPDDIEGLASMYVEAHRIVNANVA